MVRKFLKWIPFTYLWILRHSLGNPKKVLDLGCGDGSLTKVLAEKDWVIDGVELHADSAEKAEESGSYRKVYKADVTNLPEAVLKERYDVVFSSQVLEHLDRDGGEKCLEDWYKLAEKRLVVSTPVGFIVFDPIEGSNQEDNPLQEHRSGWTPTEFRSKGFIVRGQGIRFIYGDEGLAKKFPTLLGVWTLASLIFAPLVYFIPSIGTYMIAVKEK